MFDIYAVVVYTESAETVLRGLFYLPGNPKTAYFGRRAPANAWEKSRKPSQQRSIGGRFAFKRKARP